MTANSQCGASGLPGTLALPLVVEGLRLGAVPAAQEAVGVWGARDRQGSVVPAPALAPGGGASGNAGVRAHGSAEEGSRRGAGNALEVAAAEIRSRAGYATLDPALGGWEAGLNGSRALPRVGEASRAGLEAAAVDSALETPGKRTSARRKAARGGVTGPTGAPALPGAAEVLRGERDAVSEGTAVRGTASSRGTAMATPVPQFPVVQLLHSTRLAATSSLEPMCCDSSMKMTPSGPMQCRGAPNWPPQTATPYLELPVASAYRVQTHKQTTPRRRLAGVAATLGVSSLSIPSPPLTTWTSTVAAAEYRHGTRLLLDGTRT